MTSTLPDAAEDTAREGLMPEWTVGSGGIHISTRWIPVHPCAICGGTPNGKAVVVGPAAQWIPEVYRHPGHILHPVVTDTTDPGLLRAAMEALPK